MRMPAATARSICDRSSRSASDRKSTRLNSSHGYISYAVFCLKKKKKTPELQSRLHLVCRLLLKDKKHAYIAESPSLYSSRGHATVTAAASAYVPLNAVRNKPL